MKTCIDKVIENVEPILGLYHAYKERSSNLILENTENQNLLDNTTKEYLDRSIREENFPLLLTLSSTRQEQLTEAAIWRDKKWDNGRKIKIKFLDGNDYVKQQVIKNAMIWTKFINLDFEFVTDDAEIRISFLHEGSWSYIGTDCLTISDQNEPTMNFGWFNDHTSPFEFSRTTLHEFGHAIGLIHEHQSPDANIPWDKNEVYEFYRRTNGWDEEKVNQNIFRVYDNTTISNSIFDDKSIMLYPIPAELTNGRYVVGMNYTLSRQDIEFSKSCYPGR